MTEEHRYFDFTNTDRLQLLQLMIRRAMAERRTNASQRDGDESDHIQTQGEAPANIDLPDRWRLVSEEVQLHDWQRECLPFWLKQGHGTVKVATGGGKTLFALAAAEQLQNEQEHDLRLVVVVPTIPLMFQWHDEFRSGNLPRSAIGLMGGGQMLPPLPGLRVLICVLNSAREQLPALVKRAGWAERMLLVVDECHRANASQARQIFDTKPKYTLGLSATPEQDAETEALPTDEAYRKSFVGQALGPIIYNFNIKDSLAAGLLTPFEVWHIGLSLSTSEATEHARLSREISDLRKSLQVRHRKSRSTQSLIAWCQTQASRGGAAAVDAERFIGLATRRKRLLYIANARTEIVMGILSESAADFESRAIVFHEAISEIEALFDKAVALKLPAALEHSKLPDSLRAESIEAFRKGIARIIISAKSLVEGFNVPSADLGIIAASSSSVRQRIQSLGRMLRHKPGGRGARIIVLYVRDTEDEAIYEKADWESVVGAERNRYFNWRSSDDGGSWTAGLEEQPGPPRSYKSPSWEIEVDDLKPGDPYPGQTHGLDLRVDQSANLRTEDGALVPAAKELVEKILELNPYRRAKRTPAGHLIVRIDQQGSNDADWRFLGTVNLPEESTERSITRLRIKTSSGRRVIALEDDRRKGVVSFAMGPESSRTPEGGMARDKLLSWVREVESKQRTQINEIFWDNNTSYWLEIGGERIPYNERIAPLEFQL